MTSVKLRWGILGAAGIARKNWRAIADSGNGEVVALACRDRERGQRFVEENQLIAPFPTPPRVDTDYESLLAAPDIDAVYIPLPTALRRKWVLLAAEAGKHVVCEKPCAISVAELEEMIAVCRQHRVQFMDGVMFMHNQRLAKLTELLADPKAFGELTRITSAFCFRGAEDFLSSNIRANASLEPQGCLGDLGWYCIRISLWAAGSRRLLTATGKILRESDKGSGSLSVPLDFLGELVFEGGLTAGFHCSFVNALHQWAHFSGTHGNLRVDDFVVPDANRPVSICVDDRRIEVSGSGAPGPHSQEAALFRNFAEQVRSGGLEETWPNLALATQQAMDACYASALDRGKTVSIGRL